MRKNNYLLNGTIHDLKSFLEVARRRSYILKEFYLTGMKKKRLSNIFIFINTGSCISSTVKLFTFRWFEIAYLERAIVWIHFDDEINLLGNM